MRPLCGYLQPASTRIRRIPARGNPLSLSLSLPLSRGYSALKSARGRLAALLLYTHVVLHVCVCRPLRGAGERVHLALSLSLTLAGQHGSTTQTRGSRGRERETSRALALLPGSLLSTYTVCCSRHILYTQEGGTALNFLSPGLHRTRVARALHYTTERPGAEKPDAGEFFRGAQDACPRPGPAARRRSFDFTRASDAGEESRRCRLWRQTSKVPNHRWISCVVLRLPLMKY